MTTREDSLTTGKRLSSGQSQKEMSSRAQGTIGHWASPQVRKNLREPPLGICSQVHEGQEGNHGHSARHFTGISYVINLIAFYNKTTGYADEESAVAVAHLDFGWAFDTTSYDIPIWKLRMCG